jgi:hypothetical protein
MTTSTKKKIQRFKLNKNLKVVQKMQISIKIVKNVFDNKEK